MKILFITRTYPPQMGGMERYSYNLIKYFPIKNKKVIPLSKSKINLIWFLPYALIKGICLSKNVDLIYLCDGLLAPLGLIIKKITRKPVMATVHGLDVTYNNWIYQNVNLRSLKKLDKIIAVSNSTIKECIKRGIDKSKCVFIPNGVEVKNRNKNYTRKTLAKYLNIDISNKKIILTVGRLIERKGVYWFIKNVFEKLDKNIIYLVVGGGNEKQKIENLIKKKGLSNRIILLGKVTDEALGIIYNTVDLFVMPNIKVKGDMEGFGLVALEAAVLGVPVVASDLEGISDAIKNNKNGFLIKPSNFKGYADKINELLSDKSNIQFRENAKKYTIENYNWETVAKEYLNIIKSVIN